MSLRGGRVRLDRLFQQGCAKAILPRTHGAGPRGRCSSTPPAASPAATASTGASTPAPAPRSSRPPRRPSASTARRAAPPGSRPASTSGAGARLDWLPQETILFDAARLERRLEVDLAADARLTALETLVLGRAAMGETVRPARSPTSGASAAAAGSSTPRRCGSPATSPARPPAPRRSPARARSPPSSTSRPAPRPGSTRPAGSSPGTPGVTAAASAKPGILIVRFLARRRPPLARRADPLSDGLPRDPLPRVWSL